MSSVCPSVTSVDQDHTGTWKSWKLIAWTISPTRSVFVAQKPSTYSQGNIIIIIIIIEKTEAGLERPLYPRNTVDIKSQVCMYVCMYGVLEQKTEISLKRVKMEEKLLWRRAWAYIQGLLLLDSPYYLRNG